MIKNYKIFNLIGIVVYTSFCLSTTKVVAQTYAYHQVIDVTDTSGIDQFNKQFMLTIDTECPIGSGMMLPNGDDIRFYKDAGMNDSLGFFIFKNINTPSTQLLIQLDTLLALETRSIHMFYGNPSASRGSSPDFLPGPFSAIDSATVASTNLTVGAGWIRGFKFTSNENILIPNLGTNTPNPGSFVMTMWTAAGVMMTQRTNNPTVGMTFLYEDLDSAVILNKGGSYVASIHSITQQGYRYGTSTQIGPHLTYTTMQYGTGTPTTFPTSTLANYHYGLVDFLYYLVDIQDSIKYEIHPLVFADSAEVCMGGSFTFPDGTVQNNIMSSTTHTSNLMSSFMCDSIVETFLSVKFVELGVFASGLELTSLANAATYQWLDCENGMSAIPGATSKVFSVTANGSYAVRVNQNGCTGTSICYTVDWLGLDEGTFADHIKIYPNPAGDLVNIDLSTTYNQITVSIINGIGQVVRTITTSNTSMIPMNISNLNAGVYIVEIRADGFVTRAKLRKE